MTFCIEFFLFTCHEKIKEKVPKILQEALLNFRQMMELSSKQMDQNGFFFFNSNSGFFPGFQCLVVWHFVAKVSVYEHDDVTVFPPD